MVAGANRRWKLWIGRLTAIALIGAPAVAAGQTTSAPPADATPKISVSGYIQPRYDRFSENGETTDTVFLRRAVLAVKALISPSWNAELQIDAGPPASRGERLLVKDAVLRYTGWDPAGVTVTIGNQKMPFSQSSLQSASRRSLVERPFTGSSDLGAPGRSIALRADGWHSNRRVHWAAALAASHVSPEADLLSIHGITEAEDNWSEGPLVVGRIEFHPLGEIPLSQGDLERRPLRLVVNAAAYRWTNDHDIAPQGGSAVSVESMTAMEISGGLRRAGLSIDAEYHRVAARAEDPFFSNGLYLAGEAAANKASVETGYLLWRDQFEATAAFDTLDSDTFEKPWQRASIGMNWYVKGHALKFSVTHRESFNTQGVANVRSRATYLQSHIAF